MKPTYEHRQFGAVMLAIFAVPVFLFCILLLTAQGRILPGAILLLAFLLITAGLFSSLTVRVNPERVLLFFGPGFPRRSFALNQITGVRVVRNAPLMGLGIHFIRRGMIYNVSGLDGVELTLGNGRLARIGSDEPETLANAIEQARMDGTRREE